MYASPPAEGRHVSRPAEIERAARRSCSTGTTRWSTLGRPSSSAINDTFKALGQTLWTDQEVRDRAQARCATISPSCSASGPARRRGVLRHLPSHPPRRGSSRCPAQSGAGARRRRGCYVGVVSNKVGRNLRAEVAHLGWDRWISGGRRQGCPARQTRRPIRSTSRSTARELPLTTRMDGRRHSGRSEMCAAAGVLPVFSAAWRSMAERLREFPPRLHARRLS